MTSRRWCRVAAVVFAVAAILEVWSAAWAYPALYLVTAAAAGYAGLVVRSPRPAGLVTLVLGPVYLLLGIAELVAGAAPVSESVALPRGQLHVAFGALAIGVALGHLVSRQHQALAAAPALPTELVDGGPCPAGCGGRTGRIAAIDERGVPHGEPGHGTMHGYTGLAVCGSCGTGRLESFSHYCSGDGTEVSLVRVVAPDDVVRLRQGLRGCPDPTDPRCGCLAHASMLHSGERLGGPEVTRAAVAVADGLPRFLPLA